MKKIRHLWGILLSLAIGFGGLSGFYVGGRIVPAVYLLMGFPEYHVVSEYPTSRVWGNLVLLCVAMVCWIGAITLIRKVGFLQALRGDGVAYWTTVLGTTVACFALVVGIQIVLRTAFDLSVLDRIRKAPESIRMRLLV